MKRETKRTIVEVRCPFFNRNASGTAITLLLTVAFCLAAANAGVAWQRKSSSTGDMPTPNNGKEQTCCLILDIDKDGVDDFVVGERTQTPSVVWYKYNGKGWDKFVIDDTRKNPEAGGDYCDIDRDGDLDILLKPYNHKTPRIDILLNGGGNIAGSGGEKPNGRFSLTARI